MRYIKNPEYVNAVRFTQEMAEAFLFDKVPLPAGVRSGSAHYHQGDRKIWSCTFYIEDGMRSSEFENHKIERGDWIVIFPDGHAEAIAHDLFTSTYSLPPSTQVERE